MRCPYCATEIKDEAIACLHCNRDLTFFTPVIKDIKRIYARLDEHSRALSALRSADGVAGMTSAVRKRMAPGWLCGGFTFFGALLALLAFNYVVVTHTVSVNLQTYYAIAVFIPLPFGVLLGVWRPGVHVGLYIGLGFAIGAAFLPLGTMQYLALNANELADKLNTVSQHTNTMILLVVGFFLSFLSGALFGDLIETWRDPSAIKGSITGRTAERLLNLISGTAIDPRVRGLRTQKYAMALDITLPVVSTALASFVSALVGGVFSGN